MRDHARAGGAFALAAAIAVVGTEAYAQATRQPIPRPIRIAQLRTGHSCPKGEAGARPAASTSIPTAPACGSPSGAGHSRLRR